MSAIERYEGGDFAPEPLRPVSGAELDTLVRQADLLAESKIIPSAYRKQPANILTAALTGRTFGWDALTSMRNGHVIEGTWSIKPEAMLALVRRAGHSVTGETSPDGATVTGRRRDTGDEMTVTFTLTDAARAGLDKKGTWRAYPQAMCWARAVSQLCRMLFADVTLGLSYTPEELGAEVDESGEVIEARAAVGPAFLSADNVGRVKAACEEAGAPIEQIVLMATEGRTDDVEQAHTTEVQALRDALAKWRSTYTEFDDPDGEPYEDAEVVEDTTAADQGAADAADMDGAYR